MKTMLDVGYDHNNSNIVDAEASYVMALRIAKAKKAQAIAREFLFPQYIFIFRLEVFKPAPVHFCTDFTSTASSTVSTYGRVVPRGGTLLQAVRVVQDHLLNTHHYPQPIRAKLPDRHLFAGRYYTHHKTDHH
ncbi:hypothetical protein RF11_00858 [Thelohanellus kitauei]|uniref:Uncharacterized protein n=1 Tax=Thelohanellus kitauei TaxID=669202 RepID=A0A0C2MR43_THEKT|nr:hypothetical protein RF11_00858 [Thelohanellus kitauei]